MEIETLDFKSFMGAGTNHCGQDGQRAIRRKGSRRNIYERKTKQSFICLHRVLSNGVTELGVVNVEILIVIFKLRMFPYYYPGCSRGFIRKDVPSYE